MKRPTLIPGWQRAHRLLTVRAAFVLFVLNLVGALLALLAEDFPSRLWLYANTVLAAVIGYVRLIAQPGALDAPGPSPIAQIAPVVPAEPAAPAAPADPALAREARGDQQPILFKSPLE